MIAQFTKVRINNVSTERTFTQNCSAQCGYCGKCYYCHTCESETDRNGRC